MDIKYECGCWYELEGDFKTGIKVTAAELCEDHENKVQEQVQIKARLEYLRGEIVAERISYAEIAELQSLAAYIDPADVLLLEWAGVKEK